MIATSYFCFFTFTDVILINFKEAKKLIINQIHDHSSVFV